MQRLDRELSPERKRGTSNDQVDDDGKPKEDAKTTEQLIADLTLNLEEDDDRND